MTSTRTGTVQGDIQDDDDESDSQMSMSTYIPASQDVGLSSRKEISRKKKAKRKQEEKEEAVIGSKNTNIYYFVHKPARKDFHFFFLEIFPSRFACF